LETENLKQSNLRLTALNDPRWAGGVFLFRIWNIHSNYAYVARPLCSGLRRLVVFLVDGLTAFRRIMSP